MVSLQSVLIGVLIISFFTFVAFFGRLPGLRNTPIGALHRVIWIRIPKVFGYIDRLVTRGRVGRWASSSGNYLLHEKHPIVLVFFLSLVTASAVLFVPASWHLLPFLHKLLIPIMVPLPYIFTYICTRSGPSAPHLITPANHHQHMSDYPFDYTLYHPNTICRTCELPKPARSKHCSLCRACVARADHHCIWVNNCLGRGNYKHFLGLLLSISCLLVYGAYLAQLVLKPQVNEHIRQYPSWHELEFADRTDRTGRILATGERWLDVLATAFVLGGLSIGGVGLLSFLTAPLPAALLGYHIYLIWAGMTTNESSKWSDWAEDMHEGLAFLAPLQSYHDDTKANGWNDMDDSSSRSTWPVRSKHFLVRTTDGMPPRHLQPQIRDMVGDNEWQRCWHLKDVENIYDLGFWDNLKEALVN